MKQANVLIEDAIWSIQPCLRREMDSPAYDGQCDHRRQEIRVYKDLPLVAQIETVIHEVMHAQQPDLSEEAVTRRARELTRALIKTGLVKREVKRHGKT